MAATLNAQRVYVITASGVAETGTLSWSFMMKPGIPFDDFADVSDYFGFFRGKEGLWLLNVMQAEQGEVYAGSASPERLADMIRSAVESTQGLVILMKDCDFSVFQEVCRKLGLTCAVHRFPGLLATSE